MEREAAIAALTRHFGEPVDKKELLFQVAPDLVLRPRFSPDGILGSVLVFPQFRYEESHPEWQEPDRPVRLSMQQYEALVAKLDSIKELGEYKDQPSIAFVTNMTAWRHRRYAKAFITVGEEGRLGASQSVKWFCIYYLHAVTGVVQIAQPRTLQRKSLVGYERACVDGKSYFVAPEVFKKLKAKKHPQTVWLAGPTMDNFGSCGF